MTEQPPRSRIRLALTRRQKEQIRAATGREVNALELGLEGLPEPSPSPAGAISRKKGSNPPQEHP